MTVLVAAASKHGATREIAETIGRVLAERGVETEVLDVGQVADAAGYEAVVLGSAIYMGTWLEPARTFVEEHGDELAARPTWLFSSGPVGSPPQPPPDKAVQIDPILARTRAREHRLFAGRIDKHDLGLAERTVMRAVRATEGDFRNWDDVTAWAAGIANALRDG